MTRMISDANEHYALKLPFPARPTTAQLAGLRPPVYVAMSAHDH